jgi:hypothetical protein
MPAAFNVFSASGTSGQVLRLRYAFINRARLAASKSSCSVLAAKTNAASVTFQKSA